MKTETVKSIFDEECKHVKIDRQLLKRINEFRVGFENKNEEHMTFFGGNLTGVQKVRFSSQDKDKWFSDTIQIDDITLEERVLQLPDILPERHTSSDILNISVVWIIHSIMNSPHLTETQKKNGMMDTALILQYKFLTSRLYHSFPYGANPEVAAAAYARLSNKFILKQYGSWAAALRARCESLLAEDSIHYVVFEKMEKDERIVYLLNDSQGRIRDMVKNIASVFYDTNKQGLRISKTSSIVEFEGEELLKDKTKNLTAYTRYLHSIVSDKNSFIKDEIVDIVVKIQHTMPPKLMIKTLTWASANYRHSNATEIEELIDLCMTHSFGYIENHSNLTKETNDLANLISNLRGVYMSSRSTDSELLAVRDKAQKVVIKATNSKNDSVIASVRTGLLLYLVARAFAMHHYS